MNQPRWISRTGAAVAFAFLLAVAPQVQAQLQINRGQGTHQAHDFNDTFYIQNGLDPTSPDFNRRFEVDGVPNGVQTVFTETDDPTRSTSRVLPVNCGYDAAGQPLCYPGPPVFFGEGSFQDTPAGEIARELAKFRAFIFPKVTGNPLSPAPPNRRQDNMFETTKGYVGANPLGLWRLVFVSFTPTAFVEPGLSRLAPLHIQNGTDTDGTPVIKRLHVLLELEAEGLVEFNVRIPGVNPEPWVV
ncbi:MAG TPA: hypothetical protein EYQ27_17445 [Gemmatimonadetes bacterium]|nr:hypothetical protein [Gemmatimonadota bacterium]